MKKFLRILAITVLLVLLIVPTTVNAENITPTITVGSVSARAGDEVHLPITLSGNPGICSAIISVNYGEGLTLLSVEEGDLLPNPIHGGDLATKPYNLSWDDSLAEENTTGDGTLAVLHFQVNENATADNCKVTVSYDAENIFNLSLENVHFEITNGQVAVASGSYLWIILLVIGIVFAFGTAVIVIIIIVVKKKGTKQSLRITCLLLVLFLLLPNMAPLVGAAGMNPEKLCEVNPGEKVSITNRAVGVVQSTNLTFRGEGPYGFVARISIYSLSGELLQQDMICKKSDSWMELYFYGKTYVVEVLLGTLTVTYNMDLPEYQVVATNDEITWTAKTTFENIYLSVGDTAQYGFTDVFPGISIWIDDDYYGKNENGQYSGYKSSNHRVASVSPDGVITANSPGEVTVTVAYHFGLSDSNSIRYTQKCKVTVLEDYGLEEAYNNYFTSGTQKYFHIAGIGTSLPMTETDIRYRGQDYNTGDKSGILVDVYTEMDYSVIFSKPGYHTYALAPKYISDYNFVTLCPDNGDTAPIIKAVMGCDLTSNRWQNLRVQALNVKAGSNYCVDVDIDWQGRDPLAVWLQQGGTKVTFGTYESSGFIQLGNKLSTSGGPVYLYAQATDGTIVKTQVLLNVYAPVTVLETDFGEGSGLEATPEKVDGFSDTAFQIKLSGGLPIEYSVDSNGKVKGTIGLKLADSKLLEKTHYNIKNGLTKPTGSSNGGADVTELLDQLSGDAGVQPQWLKKNFAITCDVLILGCFEGYFENGRVHYTDFSLAMCVKGQAKYSQQSIAFYIPYYWTMSLEASIQTQLLAVQGETFGKMQLRLPETTVKFQAAGTLSMGIQGLAGVGAELAGYLQIRMKTGDTLKESVWTIGTTFMPLVEAFGFELKLEVWEPQEHIIYDGSKKSIYQNQSYVLAGRPHYTNTAFVGETLFSGDLSITTETVFTDLYTSSKPQIAHADGKTLLVWLDDNAHRSDENRTCLYYCIYDEATGEWSAPAVISDDGKADYTPKLYTAGGATHLVWLKASCVFQPGVTLAETAAMLDVYYAEFNFADGNFSEPANLSASEGVYDFSPYVTTVNQQLTVVWGSNHSGDLFSADKCYSLNAAQLTESGWKQQTLKAGLVPINGLTACEKDGALLVCFSGHTDGQLGTLEDLELFTLSGGVLTQVTDNNLPDSAPEYFGGNLYFYDGATLSDGNTAISFPSTRTSYLIITNADESITAVLYTVLTDDSHNIYATINNGDGWGEPICVTDLNGQYITDFSACFAGDQLVTVAALRQIGEDGTLGEASLVRSSKPVFTDLAITDASYDALTLLPNGTLQGRVTLVNTGMQTVDSALIAIYNESDDCIATVQVKDVPILPGEAKTVSFICRVNDIIGGSVQLQVTAPGATEQNTENNAYTLEIHKYDVSVENAFITKNENGTSTVTVFLENRGMGNLYDIRLTFRKDTPDGQQLDSMLVAALMKGEKKMYSIQLPTDEIDQIVYVTAQIEETENTYANNANFAYTEGVKAAVDPDEKFAAGDVNDDGLISDADVPALRQHLVGGYAASINTAACDVNSDGVVNGKDVAALRRMITTE